MFAFSWDNLGISLQPYFFFFSVLISGPRKCSEVLTLKPLLCVQQYAPVDSPAGLV